MSERAAMPWVLFRLGSTAYAITSAADREMVPFEGVRCLPNAPRKKR